MIEPALLPSFSLGVCQKTHGISGEIAIFLYIEWFANLLTANQAIIIHHHAYRVSSFRKVAKGFLLRLDGVVSMQASQALRGLELGISRELLVNYVNQHNILFSALWIDYRVQDSDGVMRGSVRDIIYTGSNDVLSIDDAGEELLVPVTNEYVLDVNTNDQLITIKNPVII